jgi:hypothetical protein
MLARPHAGASAVEGLQLFTSPTFLQPTIMPDTSMHVASPPESQSRLHFYYHEHRFIRPPTMASTASSHSSIRCIRMHSFLVLCIGIATFGFG